MWNEDTQSEHIENNMDLCEFIQKKIFIYINVMAVQ